jgi:flagellar protein FliO/FliZ
MKVVAALSVGPRERVVLVDVGGQQLLLGVAPGRVNMLHRFEQPVIASDTPSDNFGDKIRHVMQQVGPK